MANIYDMADTWNAGGTTFTAVKMNVIDTASAAASLLVDFQVGGSSVFRVQKNGQVFAPYLSLTAGIGGATRAYFDASANGVVRVFDGAGAAATSFSLGTVQIIGAQGAAVADASGGATIDAEARTALNTLLARLRTHGLIAT